MYSDDSLPSGLVQTYKKSDLLFTQGSPGEEMYIVHSGTVGIYLEGASGQKELLATMEPGDYFGEMALVDDSPRSATAIVEEDNTKLLVLDKKKFIYLIRNQPNFALLVMGKLCHQLREANVAFQKLKTEQ